ncbi:hypothetical protein ACFQX6_55640 [Streptosporangium lutulentum]
MAPAASGSAKVGAARIADALAELQAFAQLHPGAEITINWSAHK